MYTVIARTKLIFLGLFAVMAAASWGYQYFWVWPAKRCAEHRGWWDPGQRVCATPIDVSFFTHRPHGVKRPAAGTPAAPAAATPNAAPATPGAAPAKPATAAP